MVVSDMVVSESHSAAKRLEQCCPTSEHKDLTTSPPLHQGKQTSATAVLERFLASQRAVVSCSCLSAPVAKVVADAIRGSRWQDTAVQAVEATQEQSVVASPYTKAAGDLPWVASQTKAAIGKNVWGAQPVRQ